MKVLLPLTVASLLVAAGCEREREVGFEEREGAVGEQPAAEPEVFEEEQQQEGVGLEERERGAFGGPQEQQQMEQQRQQQQQPMGQQQQQDACAQLMACYDTLAQNVCSPEDQECLQDFRVTQALDQQQCRERLTKVRQLIERHAQGQQIDLPQECQMAQ